MKEKVIITLDRYNEILTRMLNAEKESQVLKIRASMSENETDILKDNILNYFREPDIHFKNNSMEDLLNFKGALCGIPCYRIDTIIDNFAIERDEISSFIIEKKKEIDKECEVESEDN